MNKKEKPHVSYGQLVSILVFMMYKMYVYVYGTGFILTVPPFVFMIIDVLQFVVAVFIGKKLDLRLNTYISRQIEILVNPDLNESTRISFLEKFIRWALVDINMYYTKENIRFRKHMAKQGYDDIIIDVHPEDKEKKPATKKEAKKK